MSLAQLFYAKNQAKQRRPRAAPPRRKILFEPMEPRLLLSVSPAILAPTDLTLDAAPADPALAQEQTTAAAPTAPITQAAGGGTDGTVTVASGTPEQTQEATAALFPGQLIYLD